MTEFSDLFQDEIHFFTVCLLVLQFRCTKNVRFEIDPVRICRQSQLRLVNINRLIFVRQIFSQKMLCRLQVLQQLQSILILLLQIPANLVRQYFLLSQLINQSKISTNGFSKCFHQSINQLQKSRIDTSKSIFLLIK